MSAQVRIGTQGWSYDDWKHVFYPPGSKQEDRLPFYASVFDTVELDTTFYHAPRATIARSWERHTPDGFRFAAKVPRAITHEGQLRGVAEQLDLFVRAMEPLGDKLGREVATAPSLAAAMQNAAQLPAPRVLICGSFLLAAEALAAESA